MRMILCTVMALLVLGCSPSNEKKAQKLIGEKLKETLNDFSSYESVKFGTLDTVYTSILENADYYTKTLTLEKYTLMATQALGEADMYSEMSGVSNGKKYDSAMKRALLYQDSVKLLKPVIDSVEQAFVPKQVGWRMKHSFRANNAVGAKILDEYTFFFNIDLTEITGVNDLDTK